MKKEKSFYLLTDLRRELKNFLEEHGLTTNIVDSDSQWYKFKKILTNIILDCPLIKGDGVVSSFAYEPGGDAQIRFRIKINKT